MKSTCTRFALFAVCLSLWLGAASVTQAADASSSNGTDLAITASVFSTTCSADNTTATVQLKIIVMSSASAAPASVTVSTDGGATFTPDGTISVWSHSGRDKSAELDLAEILTANTTTQFEVCATQPGSNGNPDKNACANLSIDPMCMAACNPPGTVGCTINNFSTFCCPGAFGVPACSFTDGNSVGTCI